MLFKVSKYLPEGLYGFLENSAGERPFFHLSEFNPLGGPPPIVGESVDVGQVETGERSPRARGVVRIVVPQQRIGEVVRFDPNVGYGFVTVEGKRYYLHRSEIASGELPRIGMKVQFFAGPESDAGKVPRAVYAQIIDRTSRT